MSRISTNTVPIPELYVSPESAQKLKTQAAELRSWDLTPRHLCDLELLMNSGFHPLNGFLGREDYESALDKMRLADGRLWPMPITLDVPEAFAWRWTGARLGCSRSMPASARRPPRAIPR